MLTIDPPPRARRAGIAACIPSRTPVTFTARSWFQSSSVSSSSGLTWMIPALLTRTSRPPWRSVAVPTASAQSARETTSRCRWSTARPSALSFAAVASPSASRTSPVITRAPSSASRRACAAPCPRAPPVISATLPSSRPLMSARLPEALLERADQPFGRAHLVVPHRADDVDAPVGDLPVEGAVERPAGLGEPEQPRDEAGLARVDRQLRTTWRGQPDEEETVQPDGGGQPRDPQRQDRKSTRLNSSHPSISYAVFC